MVGRPAELSEAALVIGLADRWHKLPEEILDMDAGTLRMLDVLRRGGGEVDAE